VRRERQKRRIKEKEIPVAAGFSLRKGMIRGKRKREKEKPKKEKRTI